MTRPGSESRGDAPAPIVAIVADDLTGATDSAVQFAAAGWTARLVTSVPSAGEPVPSAAEPDPAAEPEPDPAAEPALPEPREAGSVVSVISDARALPEAEARRVTAAIVSDAARAGADRVLLKIDSTMRGSVSGQIRGALDAWHLGHPDAIAVVCPAYPAMGRTVVDGAVEVDGDPVHRTWIGTDPVTPVITSRLDELIPGSAHADGGGDALLAAVSAAAERSDIVTVDARTDEDLARVAEAIRALGGRALPVGSAGIASAMARAWTGPGDLRGTEAHLRGRVVIVASSLHEVSRRQLDLLLLARPDALVIAPPVEELLDTARAAEWLDRTLPGGDLDEILPEVVVIRTPEERAAATLPDGSRASSTISRNLALLAGAVVRRSSPAALVLMGGEGARAMLAELRASGVLIRRAIREGIPYGTLEGGDSHGVGIVTKAGGFGAPEDIAGIVDDLLNTEHEGNPS